MQSWLLRVFSPARCAANWQRSRRERQRESLRRESRAPEREQLKRGGEEAAWATERDRSSELKIVGARTRPGLKGRKAEGKSEERWPVRSARRECWRQCWQWKYFCGWIFMVLWAQPSDSNNYCIYFADMKHLFDEHAVETWLVWLWLMKIQIQKWMCCCWCLSWCWGKC